MSTSSTEEIPEETAGPYPGDGSNGPDVLEESGIARSDIRSSFGDASGTAEGVPMTLELAVSSLADDGGSRGPALRRPVDADLGRCELVARPRCARWPVTRHAADMAIDEVLLIGGPAGVGKSTVGWEVSVQLTRLQVSHWHLEGDVLDAAWPRPPDDQHGERMTVSTMRAMAGVFAAEGYARCVYVQTASVIDSHLVTQALGEVRLVGVLLTASDATRVQRLADREIGTDLDRHVESTRRMALRLEAESPPWVRRVGTDDRSVRDIALEVIQHSGWA